MSSARVLLVQMSFLGDTILSTPLISALRRRHPDAQLWTLTTPLSAELLAADTALAGRLTYDKHGSQRGVRGFLKLVAELRALRFSAVYSLHRSLRTALLLWFAGIPRRVGFSEAAGSWLYSHRVPARRDVHAVLRFLSLLPDALGEAALRLIAPPRPSHPRLGELSGEAPVVVFPGSVWGTKRWPAKHYHGLMEQLLRRGLPVTVLGAPSERAIAAEASGDLPVQNLCGELSLQDTLWLVQRARLVVCNDSMALHIASAFQRPTVAIFCATSPRFGFGPWNNAAARVVEKQGLSCKPCHRHGTAVCPTGTRACMDTLSPGEVWRVVEEVLP